MEGRQGKETHEYTDPEKQGLDGQSLLMNDLSTPEAQYVYYI